MLLNYQKRVFGLRLTLLALPFLLLSGCGNPSGEKEGKKPMKPADAKTIDTPLDSAHYYLAVADLDKFQPGRSRRDVLNDLHWRAGSVEMADCKGRAICAITYNLLLDGGGNEESPIWLHAIFVNNKFVKFIHWLSDTEEVPYGKTTASRPRRLRVGDCHWLSRTVEAKPVSIEDLRREAKTTSMPPKHTDYGLTIAWLLLRPAFRNDTVKKPPSVDDYKRNAALRDQFNAARLDIGMTELQVESIFKTKPLEQGKVGAGLYKFYGSNESFNIDGWLHFSNVLVVFREGKATVVQSIRAGQEWRRNLSETFIDLPKRDTTDPSKREGG